MSHCERICPAFCRHWPSICPASRTPFTSVLACSLRAFCVHLASLVKHSACVRHAMGRLFLRAFRLPSASLLHASGEHLLVCPFLCLVFARTAKSKKISTLLDLCVSSLRRGHANLLCIVPILTDDPRRESNCRGSGILRNISCRRRPYRVECTGSLSTSEVKQRRARLVLGWGTAWGDPWVLSAFFVFLFHPLARCEFSWFLLWKTLRNAAKPSKN